MRWQLLNISVHSTPDSCTQLFIKNLQPNVPPVHLERTNYCVHFFQIYSSHMPQAQDLLSLPRICLFFFAPILHWLPYSYIAHIWMSLPNLASPSPDLSPVLYTTIALFSVVSVLVILSLIQFNACTAAGVSFLKKQTNNFKHLSLWHDMLHNSLPSIWSSSNFNVNQGSRYRSFRELWGGVWDSSFLTHSLIMLILWSSNHTFSSKVLQIIT